MKKNLQNADSHLLLSVVILLVIGIVMVYSASSFKAQESFGDSHFFLKKHFLKVLFGLLLMFIVSKVNYKFWLSISPILLTASVIILLFILVSSGVSEIRGSKRWINLGFMNFQPTDLARISLILFLSMSMGAANYVTPKSAKSFLFHLGVIACVVGPIMLQPDAGSAMLVGFIALTILFAAGEKFKYLLILGASTIPFLALIFLRDGYRKVRVMNFIQSIKGENIDWQALQSLIAFGNGHIFGQGLGSSRQKYHFLPDPFTDFIYSIVGEELGLFGTTLVLIVFIVLIWSGIKIALQAQDFQAKILGFGIATSIGIYAFTNMGVGVNLLPTTGVPMPFLSYGGSSLITNLLCIGILLNIANETKQSTQLKPVGKYQPRRRTSAAHA